MGRLIALFLVLLAVALPNTAAAAAAQRVASLGLCTDELVLLLAAPGQVATVSYLGKQAGDTPLAARAASIPANVGTLESALRFRPDLIVTGGAVNARAAALARRTGLPVVDLPPPASISALEANVRRLGKAMGRQRRAEALIRRFRSRLGPLPTSAAPALSVQTGGVAGYSEGIAAQLLRHAGIELLPVQTTRVSRERLLLNPPALLVRSRYRESAFSVAQSWEPPPGPWRELWLDGRLWTCPSLLAATDIARLRRQLRQSPQ